ADAVQTARTLLVTVAAELAAGVQHRHDHLKCRDLHLRMRLNRNAATIILNRNRPVRHDHDQDVVADPCHRLVNAVVDHLIDEMVQPANVRAANIHTWTLAYRLQPFENLNLGCGIRTVLNFRRRHESVCLPTRLPSRRDTRGNGAQTSQYMRESMIPTCAT